MRRCNCRWKETSACSLEQVNQSQRKQAKVDESTTREQNATGCFSTALKENREYMKRCFDKEGCKMLNQPVICIAKRVVENQEILSTRQRLRLIGKRRAGIGDIGSSNESLLRLWVDLLYWRMPWRSWWKVKMAGPIWEVMRKLGQSMALRRYL